MLDTYKPDLSPEGKKNRTARLKICRSCTDLRRPLWQCANCGCFVKAKAGMPDQHCPKGKWENGNK